MKKKYKSSLEREAARKLPSFKYESEKYSWTYTGTYTPDFIKGDTVLEIKGNLRALDEMKLKAVKEEMEYLGKNFIVVISDKNPRMPRRLMRLSEWLTKYGFKWMFMSELKEDKL